jgi:hypothetical protein
MNEQLPRMGTATTTVDDKQSQPGTHDDAEAIRRRDVATLLGGALGALALSACANEAGASSEGKAAQLAQALASVNGSADSISDLRTVNASCMAQGTAIVVLGYYARGDGGDGIFYWTTDTSTADDAATVIVPNATPRTGCWKRVIAEPINVRWFGAKGDGTTNDAPAIQSAINFVANNLPSSYVAGNNVILPPGQYLVNAPSGAAALWLFNNVNLIGAGGPPYGSQILISGPGSGVAIENRTPQGGQGAVARGSQVRNIAFYPGSYHGPQDAIVVHASFVMISDCFITGMGRHGILIESGYANSGGLLGVTKSLDGTYFNSNSWRVTNSFVGQTGDTSSQGDETKGAGIYAHGSDSNNGYASACFGQNNNVSFFDGTLGGATWVGCYSEGSVIGYKTSAGMSTYLGCGDEDTSSFPTSRGLVVGGSLVSFAAPERVGYGQSKLGFQTIGSDGATYGLYLPGSFGSALDFYRQYRWWQGPSVYSLGTLVAPQPPNGYYYKCTTAGTSGTSQPAFPTTIGATVNDGSVVWTCAGTTLAPQSVWSLGWQPYQPYANLPYQQNSWRWAHYTNNTGPDIDPANGPFGWTDVDNLRGAGLPFIGNPLINTTRRWSWRQVHDTQSQAIQLAPGTNVVYLWGYQLSPGTSGSWADSGGVTFAQDPASTWSKAQTRVSLDIEFGTITALSGADVRVVGYSFVSESGGGRNVAAKIVNAGSSAVNVAALVWHFETFVTNYDGSPS